MSHRIIRALWGNLHGEELKKFALLATGFFFLIGSFWPLKTLKDSIFINMVGPFYLPYVKIASLCLFFPLVIFYSRLVDKYTKEKLIYVFATVYTSIGLCLVYALNHPVIGLANTESDPYRWVGWAFYLFCESYISLFLTLYWSYINDITTPESAKKGYGLIIFGSQFGGLLFTMLGNFLSYDTSRYATRAPLIALISVLMFSMVGVLVFILKRTVKTEALTGYGNEEEAVHASEEKVKFLDGIKVLFTHPYVMGIFGIIFFQEIISTLMYFQLSILVKTTFIEPGLVNKFLFDFGLYVQIIACAFGLFGTSFFQRRFGIKASLIAYPISLGIVVLAYVINPTLSTIFYVMLISKALGYALNQPAKEALYIPTSRSIKYKSKAWMDMFGMRFAKATGSTLNAVIGPVILVAGSFALGLIVLWVFIASIIGRTFNKAVANNKLIE